LLNWGALLVQEAGFGPRKRMGPQRQLLYILAIMPALGGVLYFSGTLDPPAPHRAQTASRIRVFARWADVTINSADL
jgi:hypothetical protein